MEEIQLDFSCIYVRHYNLILKIIENKQWKPEMLSDLEE